MNICLYGASSNLISPQYIHEVEKLSKLLAKRGHTLVYGGGAEGLMGAAARGFRSCCGKIIGIAPSFFKVDGVLFEDCSEFIYTKTMRERKQLMEEKSDAFLVTPGGIGTFEEFFEILTLKQLGQHNKPIALFNILGYYDNILGSIERAITEDFMKPACRNLLGVFQDPSLLIEYLENYNASEIDITHLKNI